MTTPEQQAAIEMECQVEIAKMIGNGKAHQLVICGKVIRDLDSRRWAVAALLAREREANQLRAGVFRQNLNLAAECDALKARLEALLKHVSHDRGPTTAIGCGVYRSETCTCGLSAALEK